MKHPTIEESIEDMPLLQLGKHLTLPGDIQEKSGMRDGDDREVEVVAEGRL